jgi:hypothetical protein
MNLLSREEVEQYLSVLRRESTGKHFGNVFGYHLSSYHLFPRVRSSASAVPKGCAECLLGKRGSIYWGNFSYDAQE